MKAAALAGLVVFVVAPRAARAYRPFDGTDADLAEADTMELELGPLQGVHESDGTSYTPGFVFNAGIADDYELVVDGDAVLPLGAAPGATAATTDVLIKYLVREGSLQEGSGPSIAVETGVLLPTVPVHGVDEAGWSASLIASQRWDALTIHLNLFGAYERDRQLGAFASAIVEGPARWRVRPVGEVLVEGEQGAARAASVLGGVIWQRSKTFSFDAAARVQREAGETAVDARVGLTWAFHD